MNVIPDPVEFEWDQGNKYKNEIKHGVSSFEIEEVFFDNKKKIFKDVYHSQGELRYRLIGETKLGKVLFIVFTIRGEKVRVISARNINKKEHNLYEK